ncbi:MAG TPA: SDR family oxidoreductase [Gemmatimonadaceae bacterium]|jgi:NAD(P)-dependent dehydrogenase (short-subunit alcohol dehydrogenase family)
MNRLIDKVALITGGAMGIGEACARLMAKEGASVAISDLNVERGSSLAEEISCTGRAAQFMEQDVGDEAQWRRVMDEVVERFGRLDVVVNNAGLGIGGDVEHATLEDWRRLMRVNLDGVFLGTKYGVQTLRRFGGGSIVNLSSIEGLVGDPNLAAYNSSKGGVRLLTKSAALYCAKAGYDIRVNSVHPGYIWTPMVENYLKAAGDVDAGRKALNAMHPVGHIGEPNDIAYGIVYLASDESKFMTGAELVIDGGYTAQ